MRHPEGSRFDRRLRKRQEERRPNDPRTEEDRRQKERRPNAMTSAEVDDWLKRNDVSNRSRQGNRRR